VSAEKKRTARVTGNLPRDGRAILIVHCGDDVAARDAAIEIARSVAPSDAGRVSTIGRDRIVFSGAPHAKLKELLFTARDNAKHALRSRGYRVLGSCV
jgi:hypothetical protein